MEREIVELRKQLATQQASPVKTDASSMSTPAANQGGNLYHANSGLAQQFMASDEAVASLLDLRSGSGFDASSSYLRSPRTQLPLLKVIEDVELTQDRVVELFNL